MPHVINIVVSSMVFTALLLVVGVGTFRHLTLAVVRRRGSQAALLAAEPAARRAVDIAIVASLLLLAGVLGRLALAGMLVGTGAGTRAGAPAWSLVIQLGVTLFVLACYLAIRWSGRGEAAAVIGTVLLAATPMLSGHAMASAPFVGLTVLAGTFHVLGASGWLGTLTVILLAGVPATRQLPSSDCDVAVAELISAFSPAALVCAGVVLLSGTFVAWVHLGAGLTLWRSDYGRLLLIKLGVLGLVAGVGSYNWRLVRPALGCHGGTRRLQRFASLELVMALVVIVLTAMLVGVPLPVSGA